MSLEIAAQHLASRGRGPDTMLVHMAPQEVAGLQALAKAAGGTLTVNPETGLAEAGFLKSILPTVIGAGLSMIPGVGPLMAAGIVGGGTALATGNLQKGLMAGLGAYGGAGLASSLAGAGASALGAAPSAVSAPTAAASELAASQAAQTQNALTAMGLPSNAAAGVGSASFVPGGTGINMADVLGTAARPMGPVSSAALTAGAPQVATATPLPTMASPTGLEKLKAGFGNLSAIPKKDLFKYGASALMPAMLQESKRQEYRGSGPNPYNFAFDYERPEGPSYDSREAVQIQGRLRPIPAMASGGPVEDMSQRNEALTIMSDGGQLFAEGGKTEDPAKGMTGASADAFRYLMGQSAVSPATVAARGVAAQAPAAPAPVMAAPSLPNTVRSDGGNYEDDPNQPYAFNFDPATGQMVAGPRPQRRVAPPPPVSMEYGSAAKNGGLMALAAGGGVSHLGDYSDGGRLLKGPGDGVSDSIPATIANKRPARLADGEFVVPARIVSELGNGSTEAGARKLYAMMDRVQKMRKKSIGKNRVAVNSRADRALPA